MNNLEIRACIKNLIYDFETVIYLFDFERHKETLPVVDSICKQIDVVQSTINAGPYSLDGVFDNKFWEKPFNATMKTKDIRIKVEEFSKNWSGATNADLKEIEYEQFVFILQNWTRTNIAQLLKLIKSPVRRKVEFISVCSLIGTISLIFFGSLTYNYFTKNYGLKGDFYSDTSFNTHLFTGYKRTINFNGSAEMDDRLQRVIFSARWTGKLLIPKDGEYSFSLIADDGATFFLDNAPILTGHWTAPITRSSKIALKKGFHKITLEHLNTDGPTNLKLFWAIGNNPERVIPARYLRHD